MRILAAGFLYFAIVFVFAFAFGTVRTLVLAPAIGELLAVLCEAPLLIAVIAFAAPQAQRWARLEPNTGALLAMGATGLLFQQAAEVALVLAGGERLSDHLAYLRTAPGLVYLALLGVFLVMPLILSAAARKQD